MENSNWNSNWFLVLLVVGTVLVGSLFTFLFFHNTSAGLLGKTEARDASTSQQQEESASIEKREGEASQVLSLTQFKPFHILQITAISHNTKLFRLEIPAGKSLNLPIGRHLSVQAHVHGTKVIRAYTPTSKPDQTGYFDLLIKSYEFGKLSSHMHSLRQGDTIDVRGPIGRFKYTPNMHKHIGLIAGGTGLTPCLQVIRCVLQGKKEDNTNFTLFFQNRKESDILLREELDTIAQQYPNRIQIVYFLGNPQTDLFGKKTGEVRGYIAQEHISKHFDPKHCGLACICGPSGFNDSIKSLLHNVGHSDESIYIW